MCGTAPSRTPPAYQRRTPAADALSTARTAGTNTRRVGRVRAAPFTGRSPSTWRAGVWRTVQRHWQARNDRALAEAPIIPLRLDGTVVRDRTATSIPVPVVPGIREDGQILLLTVKQLGAKRQRSGVRLGRSRQARTAQARTPDPRWRCRSESRACGHPGNVPTQDVPFKRSVSGREHARAAG